MSLSYRARSLPDSSSSLEELQPFSKIKLVVLDLDGTLLKSHNGIPGERVYSLKSSVNVQLTLATGRALKGSSRTLEKLNLASKIQDKTPSSYAVVLYNGSLVINPKNNSLIYHSEIDVDSVARVVDISRKYSASVFVYVVDSSTMIVTEELERVYFFGESPAPLYDFNKIAVTVANKSINKPATALLIVPATNTDQDKLVLDLSSVEDISITSSGSDYIEIRPKNSSKANGMQHWINLPNVTYRQEEILAVGDNDNDVELLQWAGIGVAVDSASEAALNACDYVTKYGAEQGVIEVLNLIKQANRYKTTEKHLS